MENFIENMELITGTVKALEDAERASSMKRHGATPDRREVIKVIKDLQSLLLPDYYTHSEGSENVL